MTPPMPTNQHKRKNSFIYAINGLIEVTKTQWNFRFHLVSVIVVVISGIYFKVTATEWMALTGVIGLVLVSETINTAIEYLVNLVSPEWNELAGKVKDITAGAVLISAIIALITGLLIFIPRTGLLE